MSRFIALAAAGTLAAFASTAPAMAEGEKLAAAPAPVSVTLETAQAATYSAVPFSSAGLGGGALVFGGIAAASLLAIVAVAASNDDDDNDSTPNTN